MNLKNQKSMELVKVTGDSIGRLAFLFETYVKLLQAQDHENVRISLEYSMMEDVIKVREGISEICNERLNSDIEQDRKAYEQA